MGFLSIVKKTWLLITFVLLCSIVFPTTIFAEDDKDDKDNIEIPKIYITGDLSEMKNKNDKRKVIFKFQDNEKKIESNAKIKLQGAASLDFPKKNYTIDFYSDDAYKNKKNIDFGWGGYSKYILKSNWDDKTNARNIVTANVVAEVNKQFNHFTDTPNYGETDGFPVEIYVNDEFFGLYTLNIPKSDWMLGMDKDNAQNILFSSDWNIESNMFKSKIGFDFTWDFEIGEDEGHAVAQLNKVIDFIMNSSDDEFRNNINNYLDLDTLLSYYVISEFADLIDNSSKNMLVGTYDSKKWFVSLYDLNASWGVFFMERLNPMEKSNIENNLLFERIRKIFPNELANRYFALRKTILTKENIMNKFQEFSAKIPKSSIKKDQAKWGEAVGFDLSQIEEYLDSRPDFTDNYFYNLYTIPPQVYLKYETENGSAKVTLASNREDITIDGLHNGDNQISFTENGFYKVAYQDWFGNFTDSIDVGITSIEDKTPNNNIFCIVISTICSILCFLVVLIIIRLLVIKRKNRRACLKRKNSVNYKKKGK